MGRECAFTARRGGAARQESSLKVNSSRSAPPRQHSLPPLLPHRAQHRRWEARLLKSLVRRRRLLAKHLHCVAAPPLGGLEEARVSRRGVCRGTGVGVRLALVGQRRRRRGGGAGLCFVVVGGGRGLACMVDNGEGGARETQHAANTKNSPQPTRCSSGGVRRAPCSTGPCRCCCCCSRRTASQSRCCRCCRCCCRHGEAPSAPAASEEAAAAAAAAKRRRRSTHHRRRRCRCRCRRRRHLANQRRLRCGTRAHVLSLLCCFTRCKGEGGRLVGGGQVAGAARAVHCCKIWTNSPLCRFLTHQSAAAARARAARR